MSTGFCSCLIEENMCVDWRKHWIVFLCAYAIIKLETSCIATMTKPTVHQANYVFWTQLKMKLICNFVPLAFLGSCRGCVRFLWFLLPMCRVLINGCVCVGGGFTMSRKYWWRLVSVHFMPWGASPNTLPKRKKGSMIKRWFFIFFVAACKSKRMIGPQQRDHLSTIEIHSWWAWFCS